MKCNKALFINESHPFFISFPMEISHYFNFLASLVEDFQENKCYFFHVLASAAMWKEAEHSFKVDLAFLFLQIQFFENFLGYMDSSKLHKIEVN